VVIIPSSALLDTEGFAKVLRQNHVSILFQTTALFNQRALAVPQIFAELKYLLFGGEVSDPGSSGMYCNTELPGTCFTSTDRRRRPRSQRGIRS